MSDNMAEGIIFGVERPFVEDEETSLKIIVEFAEMITKEDVRRDSQMVMSELEGKDIIVNDMMVDEGITPLLMIDMARTNYDWQTLEMVRSTLTDMQGFSGMTVSSVPIGQIEKFARMR